MSAFPHRREVLRGLSARLSLGLLALPAACAGGAGDDGPVEVAAAGGGPVLNPAPDARLVATLPPRNDGDPYAPLGHVLREIRARRGDGRGEARGLIVVLGDSHTAAPFLVERLREAFQGGYGNAGLGRFPPGRAQRFFNPSTIRVTQEGDWTAENALRAGNPGPFGLSGYRLSSGTAGASITLASRVEPFDRVHLTRLAREGSGNILVSADGARLGPTPAPTGRDVQRLRYDLPRLARSVTVEVVGDGPVDLLDWGVDRRGRGMLVEGFGVSSATIGTLDNRERAILLDELRAFPPALVILAFGTNEAADRDLDGAEYGAALSRWVRTLRTALPRSGVMLLGPPDAGRPVPPPPPPPPVRGRGRHAAHRAAPRAPVVLTGCAAINALPSLGTVQDVQRRVARAEGAAYFDWAAEVTGGVCRVPDLARRAVPLMQRDFVHLTGDGYRVTAERLYEHLIQASRAGGRAA